jgi:hypothetical protein
VAAAEALQKEREDALGAAEDTRREVEEERLAATMAENIRDAAQAEAARLRTELEGMGHSLSLFLTAGAGLQALLPVLGLDAPCSC